MLYTQEITDELNVLMLFEISNSSEGIKVHKSADEKTRNAAKRLHEKGIITQPDGGYLTGLGVDAAEHAQTLFTILSSG